MTGTRARKRCSLEEIIRKLGDDNALLGKGRRTAQACKQIGVADQTFYRWRKAYGGLKVGSLEHKHSPL